MSDENIHRRHPSWLKVRLGKSTSQKVRHMLNEARLHTVCQSAACPNIGECFESGTATFLIMGNTCTRNCRFCNIQGGIPESIDEDEPARIAETVAQLQLNYAVITSVTRDDIQDGGASHFAATIKAIRMQNPKCRIEVLIPDFLGNEDSLRIVVSALPDVLNHNIETVPRLYKRVRPGADYRRSLELLKRAGNQGALTKSGIMVGLGERLEEIQEVIIDIHKAGVRILTIGQYLQPSKLHLPVARYYHPDEFAQLRRFAIDQGFTTVESAPLVRSSYHAEKTALEIRPD